MIKISHINGDEKLVTKGAFEAIFKPLGYKEIAIKENKEIRNELASNKEEKIEKSFEKPKAFGENKEENKDKRK